MTGLNPAIDVLPQSKYALAFTMTDAELIAELAAIARCPWKWTSRVDARLAGDLAPAGERRTPAMISELRAWRVRPVAVLSAKLLPMFAAVERTFKRGVGEGAGVALNILSSVHGVALIMQPSTSGIVAPAPALFREVMFSLKHDATADWFQITARALRDDKLAGVTMATFDAYVVDRVATTYRSHVPGNGFDVDRLDGLHDVSGLLATIERSGHLTEGLNELADLFASLGFNYAAISETIHAELTRAGGHGRKSITEADDHRKALGQKCDSLGRDEAAVVDGRTPERAAHDSANLHGMNPEQWRAACVLFLGSTNGQNDGVPALLMAGKDTFSTRTTAGARNRLVAGGPAQVMAWGRAARG